MDKTDKLFFATNIIVVVIGIIVSATGYNPISIIIPCHRVVGSNGDLTGYAGGLDKKRALLKLEQETASMSK